MVSQSELILKVFNSLVPGLISIFLETVWAPLTQAILEVKITDSKCGAFKPPLFSS